VSLEIACIGSVNCLGTEFADKTLMPRSTDRGIKNASSQWNDQSPVVVTGPVIGRPSAPSRVRRGLAIAEIFGLSPLPSLSDVLVV
jgi:hypothetical protein